MAAVIGSCSKVGNKLQISLELAGTSLGEPVVELMPPTGTLIKSKVNTPPPHGWPCHWAKRNNTASYFSGERNRIQLSLMLPRGEGTRGGKWSHEAQEKLLQSFAKEPKAQRALPSTVLALPAPPLVQTQETEEKEPEEEEEAEEEEEEDSSDSEDENEESEEEEEGEEEAKEVSPKRKAEGTPDAEEDKAKKKEKKEKQEKAKEEEEEEEDQREFWYLECQREREERCAAEKERDEALQKADRYLLDAQGLEDRKDELTTQLAQYRARFGELPEATDEEEEEEEEEEEQVSSDDFEMGYDTDAPSDSD